MTKNYTKWNGFFFCNKTTTKRQRFGSETCRRRWFCLTFCLPYTSSKMNKSYKNRFAIWSHYEKVWENEELQVHAVEQNGLTMSLLNDKLENMTLYKKLLKGKEIFHIIYTI